MYPVIKLKPGKERSIKNRHPWIFSGAVDKIDSSLAEGDLCYLADADGNILATGHFHRSSIIFRVLAFEKKIIDENYFIHAIEQANRVRQQLNLLGNPHTNSFRLVHGEGDGLSGLVIDIYDHVAVIQCHTRGMANHLEQIKNALLQTLVPVPSTIYFRNAIQKEGDTNLKGFLSGDCGQTVIRENDVLFKVDWQTGQKTGFFLDQRLNRKLLSELCRDKKVLNTYCYTGGFTLYAMHGHAREVHSVDSSARAIEMLQQNIALSGTTCLHREFCEDAGNFIRHMDNDYDVVILDPPAFAKNREAISNATVAYRNLNAEVFRKIASGGILFTFSCSQAIDKELFRKIIFQAAAMSNRHVRILYTLCQPPDHPVNIFHPEGEYLKGLVLMVE